MPNDLLDNEETFNILLKVNNNANLFVDLNDNDLVNPDKFSLPIWAYAAITVVIIIAIFMAVILLRIILKCFNKEQVSSADIEKKKHFNFMQLIEV